MKAISLVTDSYERKARLYPALLLLAPIAIAAISMTATKLTVLRAAGTAVVACGGTFFLAQLARDAGKRRESSLFARWGGKPSVSILRHRDARIDAITKARYHKKLATLVKGSKAPSPEDEQSTPDAADTVYTAWSAFLRTSTRDAKKFPLVLSENINYSFRRNVWGMCAFGITISAICSIFAGVRLVQFYRSTGSIHEELAAAVGVTLALLALWIFRFTPNWVRLAADAYAARLVESVDTLPAPPRAKTTAQ